MTWLTFGSKRFCGHFKFEKFCDIYVTQKQSKWNESGFRPPLCTYRLNWTRRTSWWWWDDWDDTVLQTRYLSVTELPTILTFTRGWGRNIFCFFQTAETGNRTPNSGVKGSGANHYPRAPAFKNKAKKLDHAYRTRITHDKFRRNKTQNSQLAVIFNCCFFLIISEILHNSSSGNIK